MLRVLFCGGGSIGHLAPAVAVWQSLKDNNPEAKAFFICSTQRSDREFLRKYGVVFRSVRAPKLSLSLRLLFLPILLPWTVLQSLDTILRFRPNVIFSKGGYVSVPVCLAGWMMRVPIVLHESDCVIGRANGLILRIASHLCIGAPQKEVLNDGAVARASLPVTSTGNPLRTEMQKGTREGGMRITKFSGKRPVLLVIGGSQGASAINEVVNASIEKLLDACDIIHITGAGKGGASIDHARYWQREFVYEEMPDLYALADIVVSRAGAGSIAEISTYAKAAILIPLPRLAHNHQEENARFLERAQAAVIIDQSVLQEKLVDTVVQLASDKGKRQSLGETIGAFHRPDAANVIARILTETARN